MVIDFIVKFGDDLLDDEDEDEFLTEGISGNELKEKMPLLPTLSTQFDIANGKSKVRFQRWSKLSKAIAAGMGLRISAEKHELEKSEKSLVHPALSIEEDDDGKCTKK